MPTVAVVPELALRVAFMTCRISCIVSMLGIWPLLKYWEISPSVELLVSLGGLAVDVVTVGVMLVDVVVYRAGRKRELTVDRTDDETVVRVKVRGVLDAGGAVVVVVVLVVLGGSGVKKMMGLGLLIGCTGIMRTVGRGGGGGVVVVVVLVVVLIVVLGGGNVLDNVDDVGGVAVEVP